MQKQPLVSFIIPAFNVDADMLRECLESIMALSLSREEREIILIDDGSDVPAICSLTDVADEIVYLRQPNKGLSEARNIGIKLATGRFVQFVDADDHLIRAPSIVSTLPDITTLTLCSSRAPRRRRSSLRRLSPTTVRRREAAI